MIWATAAVGLVVFVWCVLDLFHLMGDEPDSDELPIKKDKSP